MAKGECKRKGADKESYDTEDSEVQSDSEGSPLDSQEIIDVDFEFFDPKPDDFHGVKALLKLFLDETTWDLNGFVEIILSQTTVGSVIKTAEEESPIGLLSVLNLGRYKDHPCMHDVSKFLHDKSVGKKEAEMLKALLGRDSQGVGLIVSERVRNAPVDLAPPLYQGLFDEVSWATEDEPSQSLRDSFKFKTYLILTHVFEELPKKKEKSKLGKKKKKEKNISEECSTPENYIYVKPEEELLHQLSTWSFAFPVHCEALATHEVKGIKQLGLVMAIEANAVPQFLMQLSTLVESS